MENDTNTQSSSSLVKASALLFAVLIIAASVYATRGSVPAEVESEGFVLSLNEEMLVDWSDLGPALIETGVISEELYNSTELNRLWALGLANKSRVLLEGEMVDPKYGGAGGFASTGGWQSPDGHAMDHYAAHQLMVLTPEQEELVASVVKNIYRPCCDNSTHFPDCNHGMAMLGLMSYYAEKGASEATLYKAAALVNEKWFPSQSAHIASMTKDPKEAVSKRYASASGYRNNVLPYIEIPKSPQGSSCST